MKQLPPFPKPSLSFSCPADWTSMSACADGRFCGSCQKTVLDLTQKSDAEIQAFLSQQEGRICGRFYAHQLAQPVKNHFSFRGFIRSAIMLLGLNFMGKEAAAQQQEKVPESRPSKEISAGHDSFKIGKIRKQPKSKLSPKRLTVTAKPSEILTGDIAVGIPFSQIDTINPNGPVYYYVSVMPQYEPGGELGLQKFIKENLLIPDKRISSEGQVICQFIVTEEGKVIDPKILKSLSREADKEAIRVVELLNFKPGVENGQKVKVYYTVPVRFYSNSN